MHASMAYSYDIFLSYRRWMEWPDWIDAHFAPLLRHWVGEDLRRDPDIFIDTDVVEVGDVWPDELATGLAFARVMVCLWSGSYFDSSWCLAELSHMLHRQDTLGGGRIILPVLIHDGERIPNSLRNLQSIQMRDFANPRMTRESPNSEKLSERIRDFATPLVQAIERAPAFDDKWLSQARQDIHKALNGTIRKEPISLPRLKS